MGLELGDRTFKDSLHVSYCCKTLCFGLMACLLEESLTGKVLEPLKGSMGAKLPAPSFVHLTTAVPIDMSDLCMSSSH